MSSVVYKRERHVPFPRIYKTQISSDTILLCNLSSLGQVQINGTSAESHSMNATAQHHIPLYFSFFKILSAFNLPGCVKLHDELNPRGTEQNSAINSCFSHSTVIDLVIEKERSQTTISFLFFSFGKKKRTPWKTWAFTLFHSGWRWSTSDANKSNESANTDTEMTHTSIKNAHEQKKCVFCVKAIFLTFFFFPQWTHCDHIYLHLSYFRRGREGRRVNGTTCGIWEVLFLFFFSAFLTTIQTSQNT